MKREKYSHKNVFVLPSYIGIPYILRNFELADPNTVFLTNNQSLYNWLSSLNLDLVSTPALDSDLSRKAIEELKRKNNGIAEHFQTCNIYFFFYLSNIPMLHLLKLLSKKNKLHFINRDPFLPRINLLKLHSFTELKKMGVSKLAYGLILNLWPEIYKLDKGYMLGKTFKLAKTDTASNAKPILSKNHSLIQSIIHPEPIDILYIDNISVHFPQAARIVASILIKLENSGRSVHIKPHPTFLPIKEFTSFSMVKTEIPAEIVMQMANITLGVASNSLKTPIEGLKISLLPFLPIPIDFKKRYWNQIKSEQLIFAESESQLFELIKNKLPE